MTAKKLRDFFSSPIALRIAVIAGVSSVFLIFLSSIVDLSALFEKKSDAALEKELSDSLTNIVQSIDGVGRASVFLTMDNSGENVYLNNSDTKTKRIEPTVRGVVVVCDGADDPVVQQRVLSAVCCALGISSDRVSVEKLRDDSS